MCHEDIHLEDAGGDFYNVTSQLFLMLNAGPTGLMQVT